MRTLLALAALLPPALSQEWAEPPTNQSGVVVDEDGKPLAGVAVCGLLWGEPFVTTEAASRPLVRTDATGRFTVSQRDGPLPLLLFVAEGRVHVAGLANHVGLRPVTLPKTRSIAGIVRGPDGKPIAGVRVEATDWLDRVPFLADHRANFVRPWTAVRTGEDGRFVLHGTCETAMALLIGGPGIEPLMRGPVAAGDPLDFTVERFEPIVATVLDEQGKPVANEQVFWFGARRAPGNRPWTTRTDANGRAMAPVRNVSSVQCTLNQYSPYAAPVSTAYATLEAGARTALLRLVPVHGVQEGVESIAIRAVDSAGTPLASFRAAAVQLPKADDTALRTIDVTRGCERAMREALDGLATVRLDRLGTGPCYVVVDAPGTALEVHVVAPAAEVRVTVKPAAVVTGSVVDATTGAPLADARVWTVPRLTEIQLERRNGSMGLGYFDPFLGTVVTGRDGTFRLDRVPAGERHLLCLPDDEARTEPVVLRCEAGKAQDLRISVPTRRVLAGTTDLKQATAGLAIQFANRGGGGWPTTDDWDFTRAFPLATDGTFTATRVNPFHYTMLLLVDCGFRTGPPVKVLTGSMTKVTGDTEALTVPVAALLPARVQGKVTSVVPPERLAVVSLGMSSTYPYRSPFLRFRGPVCPLRRDGTYDLSQPADLRTMLVFDLMTGVILARTQPTARAPRSRNIVDFEFGATPVDVGVGGPGWKPDGCYTMEIRPKEAWVEEDVGALEKKPIDLFSYMGCRLEPGQRTVSLFLPKGGFDLSLYLSKEERHHPRDRRQMTSTMLEIESGASRTVTLELPEVKPTGQGR